MKIYVGNIAAATTETELNTAFAAHGTVETCRMATDKVTGARKGFGFVEMSNDKEAGAAITALNGTDMGGNTLKVNESRPKADMSGASH